MVSATVLQSVVIFMEMTLQLQFNRISGNCHNTLGNLKAFNAYLQCGPLVCTDQEVELGTMSNGCSLNSANNTHTVLLFHSLCLCLYSPFTPASNKLSYPSCPGIVIGCLVRWGRECDDGEFFLTRRIQAGIG